MIIFNSAHGKFELPVTDSNISVLEFLRQSRIPVNAVSLYGKNGDDASLELIVGEEKTIDTIENIYTDLIVQPDRNIKYQNVLNRPINVFKEHPEEKVVGEYLFDTLNEDDNPVLKKFTVEEAKAYVNEAVGKVLSDAKVDFNKKIVFGISGGGDSNTLLEAFIANGFPRENLVPVMVHGIPDMDQGTNRARIISEEQGLDLIELSPTDIDDILGRQRKDGTWAEDYERIFEDDLESIATLVIRLGLSSVAKKVNAQAIVTGLNLEDILSESMSAIARGITPPPFPVRNILDTKIMYPLYRVPKKILDATHPSFSLENYIQRFPSNAHWRAVMYYFAQSVSSNLPGMEFRLIDGLQKISMTRELDVHIDERLGLPVMGPVDDETVKLWEKFIKG